MYVRLDALEWEDILWGRPFRLFPGLYEKHEKNISDIDRRECMNYIDVCIEIARRVLHLESRLGKI